MSKRCYGSYAIAIGYGGEGVAAVPTVVSCVYLFDQNQGGYFSSTSSRFTFDHDSNLEMARMLHEAGVKLGVGTDLIYDSCRYLPESYVWELKYLVEGGLTRTEALTAATRTNPETLDMNDRLGTIERGKRADILVVDGDSYRDLDCLLRTLILVKDARWWCKMVDWLSRYTLNCIGHRRTGCPGVLCT